MTNLVTNMANNNEKPPLPIKPDFLKKPCLPQSKSNASGLNKPPIASKPERLRKASLAKVQDRIKFFNNGADSESKPNPKVRNQSLKMNFKVDHVLPFIVCNFYKLSITCFVIGSVLQSRRGNWHLTDIGEKWLEQDAPQHRSAFSSKSSVFSRWRRCRLAKPAKQQLLFKSVQVHRVWTLQIQQQLVEIDLAQHVRLVKQIHQDWHICKKNMFFTVYTVV